MSSESVAGPSNYYLQHAQLIKQGAEARVYLLPSLTSPPNVFWPKQSTKSIDGAFSTAPLRETLPGDDGGVILKHRFPKTYRHPTLNSSLTKSRLSYEARALARCAKSGLNVPKVLWVDEKAGVLGLERIHGWSIREILGGGAEGEIEGDVEEELADGEDAPPGEPAGGLAGVNGLGEDNEGARAIASAGISLESLMSAIGKELGRLHALGIIHGDLTTSNMMLRLTPGTGKGYEIVLIDFGLSSSGSYAEHYAVDLYVLERAFASTHPASEGLYAGVLEAYATEMGAKKWKPIELKLKDVRRRGRKRDMTG